MFYVLSWYKGLESASKVRQIGLLEGWFEMLIRELHWDYDAQLIGTLPFPTGNCQWDKEINLFGERVKWIEAKAVAVFLLKTTFQTVERSLRLQ